MAELNHFAISAGMGSTLGHRLGVRHGQLGSAQLAATLSAMLQRRKAYIDDLSPLDDLTKKYEKAVTRAYLSVRQDYSSDRVLADPRLNAAFIKACRDLSLDDTVFHLNLALIGLRKHNKLKAKSKRSTVAEQWRYAVASEISARVIFYRYRASVDTMLAHPKLVDEFDKLASSMAPGYSPFEYRWAALNVRKKGSNIKLSQSVMGDMKWTTHVKFNAASLPTDAGVYTLFDRAACLFVAGTEDIENGIRSQKRIAEVPLFEPELWRPDPERMFWQYVRLPKSTADYRFGVVRSLVGSWEPVFNIPRGRLAA